MNNTLESHKFFPYIAWTLVISFALFTYTLVVQFQKELATISDGVERLEQKVNELDVPKKSTTPTTDAPTE